MMPSEFFLCCRYWTWHIFSSPVALAALNFQFGVCFYVSHSLNVKPLAWDLSFAGNQGTFSRP